MSNKMISCKTCGQMFSKVAKSCPHCGEANKKPIYKQWWFWTILVFFISFNVSNRENLIVQDNNEIEQNATTITPKTNKFSEDCGILATAEMGTDIIGQPTVSISITNTTNKDINAIKFYVVPLDVYGEELNNLFTNNILMTDDVIMAKKTTTRTWQFLDNKVKTIKLYVYSVYFSDGTEWGDREATKTVILKNAPKIIVE